MKERQSNYEGLRIIAMLLIVLSHYGTHGTYQGEGAYSLKQLAAEWMILGGKLGVIVYVMIGSYFLLDQNFKSRRPLWLGGQTFIYSWVALLMMRLFYWQDFSTRQLAQVTFPFPAVYWFVDYYLMLNLLSPYLNHYLKRLSKESFKQHLALATILVVLAPVMKIDLLTNSRLILFVYLYLLTAYLKWYAPRQRTYRRWFFVGVVAWGIESGIFQLLSDQSSFYVPQEHSISVLAIALALFLACQQRSRRSIPWINRLASSTFGVYLLHEQVLVRQSLWAWVDNRQYSSAIAYVGCGLLTTVSVFFLATILDQFIQLTLSRWLYPYICQIGQLIDQQLAPFLPVGEKD